MSSSLNAPDGISAAQAPLLPGTVSIDVSEPPSRHKAARSRGQSELDTMLVAGSEDESSADTPEKNGTVVSSIANLAGTILGSSTFAMASAAANAGLVLFGVLLVCVGLMAEQSIQLLMRSMAFAEVSTFPGLGLKAAGRVGEYTAVATVIIQQLGATIAYMQIIGTVLKPLVSNINGGQGLIASEAFWQTLLAAVVVFPLCMLPRITTLRYSSMVSVCLICSFIAIIVADGAKQLGTHWSAEQSTDVFQHGVNWATTPAGPTSAVHVLLAIPVLAFAQVCQMNVFPVVTELQDPSTTRLAYVSRSSVILTGTAYALAGYFGYFAFGTGVQADILGSYEAMQGSPSSHQRSLAAPEGLVKAWQGCIALALTMSFPVVAYELRHSIEFLLVKHAPFNWTRHTLANVFIVGVSTLVAILIPDVGVVFGFTGATTSCMMVFILPAWFYLRVAPGPIRENPRSMVAVVILVVGIALVPACLAAQVLKLLGK